jgi:hypothetical protein
MKLSMSLINRLHLGRSIAAEVSSKRPNYRAWVYVKPVVGQRDVVDTEPGIESRIASPTSDPVNAFDIRYTKFHEDFLEERYDLDRVWQDELTTDERYEAHSIAELEQLLGRWIHDFAVLGIPANVDYQGLPPKPRWIK